jgi:hypothetical protein
MTGREPRSRLSGRLALRLFRCCYAKSARKRDTGTGSPGVGTATFYHWRRSDGGLAWKWRCFLRAGFTRRRVTDLDSLGRTPLPHLRELLRDHPRIWIVIGCLQEVQTDEALKALIPLLSHSNPKVRQEALFAVLEFGKRADVAGEEIARLADDENEDTVRRATIYAADFLPADRAIPLLVQKLKDPRPRIARAALDSFIGRGPAAEPVMPVIAEALTSADEKTRKAATNALETINPYRACEFGIDTNGTSEWVYRAYHDVRQRLATNTSSGRSW